jgi:AraC family transcriptional regulator of adaptative response / DNA-3-methyladenine glycosylase II
MDLDPETCYVAYRSHDLRFDGRFFIGVVTTRVYCRPICPVRMPRREHMRFFACAAAAEEQGFRPCRRCRPETAPGSAMWSGTSAVIARALRLIASGILDRGGENDLAQNLGYPPFKA